MRGAPSRKDHQKYCQYHRDIGHNTNECRAVKDTIEDLIRRGHLKESVKKALARERGSRRSHEQYAREAKAHSVPQVMSCEQKPLKRPKQESEVIRFTREECEESPRHNHDAIVIATRIGNARVLRVMVYNSNAVNIIFLGAFREIRFSKRDMKASPSPLYRFTGESLVPKGIIDLPVTLGEEPKIRMVMVK
ncbi:uncharacterized protein LOC116110080 [Pistacia vera]|uniref:uncharacterized protein LOC116110080 n=1 Tax=Pistacia vera TaxID=55513 RepID=UPI0012635693|nr:uncharacterized protein LOC116110080 [Pistacia vera]